MVLRPDAHRGRRRTRTITRAQEREAVQRAAEGVAGAQPRSAPAPAAARSAAPSSDTSTSTRSASRAPRATSRRREVRRPAQRLALTRLSSSGPYPPAAVTAAQRPVQPAALPAERAGLAVPARPVHPDRDRAGRDRARIAMLVFFASALGVVPTAALMGRATEELAHRSGPGIGGLLNVTFGNAPELIIALFALHEGPAGGRQGVDHRLDPRQPAAGDGRGDADRRLGARAPEVRRRGRQRAGDDAAAGRGRARAAGDVPALARRRAAAARRARRRTSAATSSRCPSRVAIVLLLSYVAGLWFSLKTHRDVFNPDIEDEDDAAHGRGASGAASALLAGAGVAVGVMSEILVGSIEEASEGIGLSPFFVVADHRRDRRQRGRALGRGLLRRARQDGPRDRDRDRLERPDRAVRDAGARAAVASCIGPVPALAGVQRAGDRGDPARGADRRARDRRTASRPGSRACSSSRSTSSSAIVFFFV